MATRKERLIGFLILGLLSLAPSRPNAEPSGSIAATETTVLAETVQSAASRLRLAEDKQWLRLLHADSASAEAANKPASSQIDGAGFFLAPDGKSDPAAELHATIDAFFSSSEDLSLRSESEIPQCRFPARWLWLKSKFAERAGWPEPHCPNYAEFKTRVAAKSVSLVFSSYYVNNPASGFGHTLLRLSKSERPEQDRRHELLDYGVNFAARPTTDNPILYTFDGLFGFFPGIFTAVPYFFKVREYNDFESRDLWSYNLKLSQAAVDFVVAHIWELAATHADYYYLTENCAYHMFSILEAAEPGLELKSRLKTWVIPGDTVQVVNETPGLVTGVQYRPSARVTYHSARSQLAPEELTVFDELIRSRDPSRLEAVPSTLSRARIIEAAFTYLDYAHFKQLTAPTPEKAFKDRLLLARSRLKESTVLADPPVPWNEAPHLAHPSRRWGVGARSDQSFLLQYRFALHDLTDALDGYPDQAEIVFFDLGARAQMKTGGDNPSVELERFVLFDVVSLAPSEPEFPRVSWRFRVGWDRSQLSICDDCSSAQVAGGFGQTYEFARGHSVTGHLHLQGELLSGEAFLLAGPLVTLRSYWTPSLISALDLGYRSSLGRSEFDHGYGRWVLQKTFQNTFQTEPSALGPDRARGPAPWALAFSLERTDTRAREPEHKVELKLFAYY